MPHATAPPDIETASATYAKRFAGPVGAYMLEVQAEGVRHLLSGVPLAGGRVLEVGGGHAQLTRLLLALGAEVWVQGSAPCCAERLAPLLAEAGGRLRFLTSDLLALPFADRSFDLVIGIRLMAHVEHWEELLSEMSRVCRGCLLVDYAPTRSVSAFEPWLYAVKRVVESDTRRFARFSIGQLAPVLRELGFVDISERKQFLMPMVIHRVLKRPELSRRVESWGDRLGLTRLLGGPALLLAQRRIEQAEAWASSRCLPDRGGRRAQVVRAEKAGSTEAAPGRSARRPAQLVVRSTDS